MQLIFMVFVGCTTAEEGVLLLHYYNIVHFIKISESFYPTRLNPSTRLFIKIKYIPKVFIGFHHPNRNERLNQNSHIFRNSLFLKLFIDFIYWHTISRM